MAGNPKTPKAVAPKSAQDKAMGRVGGGNVKVSKQTVPGSKGVRVGVNAGKAVVSSTAPKSAASKYKMGGKVGKKK